MTKVVLPDWAMTHAEKCKQAFGLWDWDIGMKMVKNLKHEGKPVSGQHSTSYRAINSVIKLKATLTDNDFGYATITHEALHIALIEPDVAFRQVLTFVPEEYKAHCRDLYDTAKEHTIEKLARSLTPMLRIVQQEADK